MFFYHCVELLSFVYGDYLQTFLTFVIFLRGIFIGWVSRLCVLSALRNSENNTSGIFYRWAYLNSGIASLLYIILEYYATSNYSFSMNFPFHLILLSNLLCSAEDNDRTIWARTHQ